MILMISCINFDCLNAIKIIVLSIARLLGCNHFPLGSRIIALFLSVHQYTQTHLSVVSSFDCFDHLNLNLGLVEWVSGEDSIMCAEEFPQSSILQTKPNQRRKAQADWTRSRMIIKSGQRETRIQFRLHFQSMTNPSPATLRRLLPSPRLSPLSYCLHKFTQKWLLDIDCHAQTMPSYAYIPFFDIYLENNLLYYFSEKLVKTLQIMACFS